MKKIAVLLLLLSCNSFADEPIRVKQQSQKVLSTENGRYIFGQISDFRADQYMLDTQTGKLWSIGLADIKVGDKTQEVRTLTPVQYLDTSGSSVGVLPKQN